MWENAFYHIIEVGEQCSPVSHATLTTDGTAYLPLRINASGNDEAASG